MDRPAKLRKLETFRRRLPHVSASALSVILSEQEHERPEVYCRNAIREARNNRATEQTPYGTLTTRMDMECLDGSHATVFVVNLFAMLFIAAKTCRGFSYMLKRALEAHPSTYETPWSLVIYADEVVPGNQLSFKSRRSAHSAHLHWRTVEDSYIRVIVSEVNQSITQSANRLIDRSIDRSMDRSNDRSGDRSSDVSMIVVGSFD